MKKWAILFLCVILTLSLTACAPTKKDTDATTTTSAMESVTEPSKCQHTYKEHVQREPDYGIKGWKILSCTICGDVQHEEISALPPILELKVKNKSVLIQEKEPYDGSAAAKECYVFFDIDLKNLSDKTIKEVKGDLTILYKNTILSLSCSFEDLSIEGYATMSLEPYGYSFNYISTPDEAERRIYDAAFEDLTFTFELSSIVVEE